MNFTIIHGTGGTPEGNWFPWLSSELVARGHTVISPRFPTPERQNLSTWFETFEQEVGVRNLGENSVLIGHSLGAPFVLRVLEQLSSPIAGAFLVAGLTGKLGLPEFDELNSTFVAEPFHWKVIRANVQKIFVYHAPNDPYAPLEQGVEIATALGGTFREIPGGGHLNGEFGYFAFEELLKDIVGEFLLVPR